MNNYILYWFIGIILFILFFKMTKKYGNKNTNSILEYENPLLLPQYQQSQPNLNIHTHMPEMPQININNFGKNIPNINHSQFEYPVLDGINNNYKNTLLKMKSWY
jgi:hypothetical protein